MCSRGLSFGVDRDDKKVPRSLKADATKIIVAESGDFKLSIISVANTGGGVVLTRFDIEDQLLKPRLR